MDSGFHLRRLWNRLTRSLDSIRTGNGSILCGLWIASARAAGKRKKHFGGCRYLESPEFVRSDEREELSSPLDHAHRFRQVLLR